MISIILPVFWQDFYTKQILEDIPIKIKSDYEIILLDWPEWVNEKWNKWYEQAKWDYLLFLNNDLVLTEWIDLKLIEVLKHHKIACPYTTEGKEKFFVPLVTKENNIAWWCFMIEKKNWIPIDERLDIWFWDNWIYEKLGKDVWYNGIVHHFVSKTLQTPEKRQEFNKRLHMDVLNWNIIKDTLYAQK